jgi:hypothetical protein
MEYVTTRHRSDVDEAAIKTGSSGVNAKRRDFALWEQDTPSRDGAKDAPAY